MRLAVVGNGWATRHLHLPALRANPKAELVGGCDTDPERRMAWEQETETSSFGSVEELLERRRPEAVIVATPPDSHSLPAIAALEAGAHVLCEKPLANSVVEANRILSAAETAGRRVAVNHHMRQAPIFKALRERIASGIDGQVTLCQVTQLVETGEVLAERAEWRRQLGGGILLEAGIHLVDLINYLLASTPLAVTAHRSSGPENGSGDPIALVTSEYPSGALAQLTMQRLFPAATRYAEVRADCERASLRASIGGRALLRVGKERGHRAGVRLELAAGGAAWVERGRGRSSLARNRRPLGVHESAGVLADAIEAFERDREPSTSGRDARNAIAVVEAAYRSAAEGRRVAVD